MEKKNLSYIFTLTDKTPPSWYPQLSALFNQHEVTLVAIDWESFGKIAGSKNSNYLIIIVNNLQMQNLFLKVMNKSLLHAILNKKVTLFHFSSFFDNPFIAKIRNCQNYYHHQLPLQLEEMSHRVVEEYNKLTQAETVWPWGRYFRPPKNVINS